MLNCFDIRSKNEIFSHHKGDFGYDYYHDPKEPLAIYVEYNIICDAQYLYCYWLKEDRSMKGAFLLMENSNCNGGFVRNEADIAGFNEEDALNFLIKRVIEPIRKHDIGADIEKLRERLKEVVRFPEKEGV